MARRVVMPLEAVKLTLHKLAGVLQKILEDLRDEKSKAEYI